jgi:formylglycine-generating enzyme required for sulfatase activity
MVRVAKRYCVDRFEATLLDARSGERISPYYAPSKKLALYSAKIWQQKRLTVGDAKARAMPLPELPSWQRERDPEPKAVARKGTTPNGHVSGEQAVIACRNAGKRLCTIDEWRIACMGEREQQFPYGPDYQQGKCNVFRFAHPAMILHDNPSKGHSDPRLNQVRHEGKPLLRKTGATAACKSEWDGDGIYDMVGNLDEWVDNAEGQFAGGFYARSTKEGCKWSSTAHPAYYADYSTGVRCCADLPGVDPLPKPARPEDGGAEGN